MKYIKNQKQNAIYTYIKYFFLILFFLIFDIVFQLDGQYDPRFKGLKQSDIFSFLNPQVLRDTPDSSYEHHGDSSIKIIVKIMRKKDSDCEFDESNALLEWCILRRLMILEFENDSSLTLRKFWQPHLTVRDTMEDGTNFAYRNLHLHYMVQLHSLKRILIYE